MWNDTTWPTLIPAHVIHVFDHWKCVCVCVRAQPSSLGHPWLCTKHTVWLCVAAYLTHLSAIAFPLHLPGVFAGLQALWKWKKCEQWHRLQSDMNKILICKWHKNCFSMYLMSSLIISAPGSGLCLDTLMLVKCFNIFCQYLINVTIFLSQTWAKICYLLEANTGHRRGLS